MSKLSVIENALRENQSIFFIMLESNYVLKKSPDHDLAHLINFCVAPKSGIYEADDLQEFLISLIPKNTDPEPISSINSFSERQEEGFWGSDNEIEFGYLTFNEIIGEEITRITLTEENTYLVKDFSGDNRTIEKKRPLERRIFVRLFPNFQIASLWPTNQIRRISKKELKKYLPKPFPGRRIR